MSLTRSIRNDMQALRLAPFPKKSLLRQRCRACGRLHGVPQLQQVLRIELEGALLALRI